MTPVLKRDDRTDPAAPREIRETRTVQWFGIGLLAVALAVGGILFARGSALPPVGPVLLLASLLALSINRSALFPTELAATAEPAAIVAAIVAFGADAPLLGPLVVALFVGPLDALHWEQRAFTRMAHNAGDSAIAALLAAAVFGGIAGDVEALTFRFVAAAASAAVVFAMVEIVLDWVLLRLRGEPPTLETVKHAVMIDSLTVPLGLVGAGAGYLAVRVGWWAGAPVLAPTAFVPELVLVPTRRLRAACARGRRVVAGALAGIAVAAALVLSPSSIRMSIALLAILSAGLGLEFTGTRTAVAPLTALVVAPALVLARGSSLEAKAAVAIAAAVVVCVAGMSSPSGRSGIRLLLATGGAGAAVLVFTFCAPSGNAVFATAVASLVASFAFVIIVVILGSRSPRRNAVSAAWAAPLVAVAALLATTAVPAGPFPGAVATGAGVTLALLVTALAGSPPWRSRWLGRYAAARSTQPRAGSLGVLACVVALGLAVLALASTGNARTMFALAAASTAELAIASGLAVTRQWRFAPRARARDASLLAGAAVVVLVAYLPLALAGRAWALPVLAIALLPAFGAATRVARFAKH